MKKYLIVDDDDSLCDSLCAYFAARQISAEAVHSGEDALQLLTVSQFDLIFLDWMLPGITGLEVCARLRKAGVQAYIIFLTGEGDVSNIQQGLESGGDDYLVKPFDLRELEARTKALYRRSKTLSESVITVNEITLNLDLKRFTTAGREFQLTPKESQILEFLMSHSNRPYTASMLYSALWPTESEADVATVRTCVHTLRQKLSLANQPEFVKSIPRIGYVVESS